MDDKTKALLVFAVIGIVAGFFASFIVGGGGLIQYLLSGVIGAFVGGWLLGALGVNLGIKNPLGAQIVTATIGAIVVVLLAQLIA
ncbi:MAG: GlsB/YeaQ/YmgE family stress response membrane protein [Hyphomicrobium sp.]